MPGTTVGTGETVVNQTHSLLFVGLICMGGREAINHAFIDLPGNCEEVKLTGDWM